MNKKQLIELRQLIYEKLEKDWYIKEHGLLYQIIRNIEEVMWDKYKLKGYYSVQR